MRRRLIDLVVLVVALGALAYGAVTIGRLVIDESNDGFSRSSGSTQPFIKNTSTTNSSPASRHRVEVIVGTIVLTGGAILVTLMIVGAVMRRRPRHEPWRLR